MLDRPPPEMSVQSTVRRLWEPLKKKTLQGIPIDFDIIQIEKVIDAAKRSHASGKLHSAFDWISDIHDATVDHEFNKVAASENEKLLLAWSGFWKERAASFEKIAIQAAQELMKYGLAVHGALAIACISALGNEKNVVPRELYFCGLFVAAVGVLAVAASHYSLNAYGQHYFSRISGKVLRKRGWRSYVAISRWVSTPRMRLWEGLSTWLTVGALLLFGFYIFVFFMIVVLR